MIRGGENPKLFLGFFIIGKYIGTPLYLLQATPNSEYHSSQLLSILFMFVAIILCGLGYAEGAKLSRKIGGWQVICWALAIALPIMLIIMILSYSTETLNHLSLSSLFALLYVSLFSMLIGFFFWYYGLAHGGIATVGQLQLLQPLFGLGLAALLLHESVSWIMLIITLGIIACVAFAKSLPEQS